MLKFRGYISSRALNDGSITDQSIQNLVIRTACEKRKFNYMLSATEYGMKNSYLMLNQVLSELKKKKFDGIAFYSIEQLPNNQNLRNKIYNIAKKYNKIILLSLEGIILSKKKEIEEFENLFKIRKYLKYSPKVI
tara:strand:- start:109 stop:513 length:405 start_codon:yes stop_codon:yes gene_type:complete